MENITRVLAQLTEEDITYYSFGECLAFAGALQETFPELELGLLVLFYGDPEDPDTERHVVATTRTHSLDASGIKTLEEETIPAEHVEAAADPREAAEIMGTCLDTVVLQGARELLASLRNGS